MSKSNIKNVSSLLDENRVFPPPVNFSDRCGQPYIASMEEYELKHSSSINDTNEFWDSIAQDYDWFQKWTNVCQFTAPDAKWFVGGKTNLCHNCIDRHILSGHQDEIGLIWEGEPWCPSGPEVIKYTYADMKREVSRCANALKSLGVTKGDVVTLYMGMVPELAFMVLACARIGAPHSVIFGGFSSQSIVDRVEDAQSKIIVTCDGAWRRGKVVPLKENVDIALQNTSVVESVLVVRRCFNDIEMQEGRDKWWHDFVDNQSDECPCEWMDSEDMLFLLYTSGSTGKPKGIIHTTGGYMVWSGLTARNTFNLHPSSGQVYWCSADIGWITGHSYIIYGILSNRITTLMYEGAPNAPDEGRFWSIIERHKVTHFYTAPTAIRAFMKWGDAHIKKYNIDSLVILGTVGEPINPEAWMWYHKVIGQEKCPIVDTWWQTETGGHMITPSPAATPAVPGSCTLPFLGVDAAVVDEEGNELPFNQGGLLVIRKPWPGMLRGIYGDRDRFIETYWSKVKGMYFAGDSARRDDRGYFWIMGRIDDVINVSGHRLGTMEVESALVGHGDVVEAAVVGMPHEIKGTGIAAFCTLKDGINPSIELKEKLINHVANEIGAIAKPDLIRFSQVLPKTRSGKIMRRLLRDVASGKSSQQDITTLEDFSALESLYKEE